MGSHPIENIMQTTMESIRSMVDVNTIVGDTVVMGNGTVIIPISKVSFGFVAGGGEYNGHGGSDKSQSSKQQDQDCKSRSSDFPFAGGSGAGVSISPMAFLVVSDGDVQLLPVQFNNSYERLMDKVPDLIYQVKEMFSHNGEEQDSSDGGCREHEGKRSKHNKFDEEQATGSSYRSTNDEL